MFEKLPNRNDLAALIRRRLDAARQNPGVLEAATDVRDSFNRLVANLITALLHGGSEST